MTKGEFVSVNGLAMYYERHGTGKPLLLLPGGYGGVDSFETLLAPLAETRLVIPVELQGHGHTADIDRPLSFEDMADDIALLIEHLGYPQADVLGYSLGGGVAIQTVIRHPNRVGKLVVVSAPCKSAGWYPEVLVGMRANNAESAKTWVGSPMHQAYARVAPRPEDWPRLAIKIGQLLGRPYDWSEHVKAIKSATLIVVGDADAVNPDHAVEFFALLGGGKGDAGFDGSGMSNAGLAILPRTTHYNIISSPALPSLVMTFLD